MVRRVIFPAARSGLLAAVLLGVGRAVGETMAVLMCTGHSVNIPFDGQFPFLHVLESVRTLTATITAELGEAPRIDAGLGGVFPPEARHYQALFAIGIVLFAISFVINLTADLIVKGIRGKR
jgi:phosphate transport system permease protein